MHRYRAILIDPADALRDRPLVIFGNDRAEIDRWADTVIRGAISPNAVVNVFESREVLVGRITKPVEAPCVPSK